MGVMMEGWGGKRVWEGCDVKGVVVKDRVHERECSIMGWRIEEKYDTVIGLVGVI